MIPEWHGLLAKFLGEKDQTHREAKFQDWLYGQLLGYFRIARDSDRQVQGRLLRSKQNERRPDFLCGAREQLIGNGFTSAPFAIEAKFPLGWDANGDVKSLKQWLWQMIEYRHSEFSGKRGWYVPAFVLSCPPFTQVAAADGRDDLTLLFHGHGIGELTLRPRRDYDPAGDVVGNPKYETVIGIRLALGASYWTNIQGRMRNRLGRVILDKTEWLEEEEEAFLK